MESTAGGRTKRAGEPGDGGRCLNSEMQGASVEMLGSVPAAVAVSQEDPDSELVARWKRGELAAFETLIRRHERRVFRLLLRMLGNRQDAEDAAQEAFLSLHRHGHRFRGDARFSTFVYRVAANAALNRRRSLGRARSRERELAERQALGSNLPASPRDPEGAASSAEIQARVQAALLELPDDLRVAVVLYDLEGQSYRDIAETLGIPEGTVKSRIHRARGALRGLLGELVRSENETGDAP